MFRNYLATALRNFAKHKLYSFINVAGLAVGLACAIFIVLFLRDELSYDRWIPGSSNLYRVEMTGHAPGRPQEISSLAPLPLPGFMRAQLPEVTAMTQLSPQQMIVTVGDRQFAEVVMLVDPGFLQVIKLPLVEGDPAQVFVQPESIVLSQSAAMKYFGGADPLGRFVSVNGVSRSGITPEPHTLTVTGVLRDLPQNTHLSAELLVPNTSRADNLSQIDRQYWWSNAEFAYVTLAPNSSPDKVLAKLNPLLDKATNPMKDLGLNLRTTQLVDFHLTPFNNIHLTSDNYGGLRPPGSWTTIYGFVTIAVLILLVACFNFTNLATARSTLRAREIALRKTVGATRRQLIAQFLGEALLTALIALVIALALVEVLLPTYDTFLDRPISFHYLTDWPLFVAIVGGALVAGLMSGAYPAFVLSGFRPGAIAKTSGSTVIGSGALRTVLVVLQFSVSIGLGIAAIVVFRQIDYAHKIDVGFNREGIVVVAGGNLTTSVRESFVHALSANPDILGVAQSSLIPFGGGWSNSLVQLPDGSQSKVLIATMDISPEFPSLYGMQLLEGRLLSKDHSEDLLLTGMHISPQVDPSNEGRNVLVNLAAARRFGYTTEEALGKTIIQDGARVTIVGVLGDSKIDGTKTPVRPMIFGYFPGENFAISVRVRAGQLSEALSSIDRTWRAFAPGFPIQRYFLTDVFEFQFKADQKQGEILGFFVGVAIFIACLGLFGLAAFTAERRTKEIGVRKVFGARTRDIVRMLLWRFSIPVVIANAVAWPVAYYYLHHWLESYAYRISLSPIYFLLAGGVALAIAWITVLAHALRVGRANPIHALRYE
ncbi:MAG TPA: FtsX-like permease family protein [Steroidobacteraceae bacterium]